LIVLVLLRITTFLLLGLIIVIILWVFKAGIIILVFINII